MNQLLVNPMNINHVCTQAQRYNSGNYHRDRCLYEIGKQALLFTANDFSQIRGGELSPQMRSRVLHWLRCNANQIGLTTSRYKH